jgi:hypothetical protein
MSAAAHLALGSLSTRSARVSRLSGIASRAPNGPSTNAHTISDKNVIVVDSPTASPKNLGWMNDWITTLIAT